MIELKKRHCEACEEGAPPITQREIDEFMPLIPDWRVVELDGVQRLQREFDFNDFVQALEFVNKIGQLAEAEAHHPSILLEYGRVTLTWWTRKIRGLHVNDFIMVARSDELA